MGISFKVSKIGARYKHIPQKALVEASKVEDEEEDFSRISKNRNGDGPKLKADTIQEANDVNCNSASLTGLGGPLLPDLEKYVVSFTLNLFKNGYIIGKPTEMENLHLLLQDGKSLHPYDRASETLFSAIQTGWLPGDILDDIPSKYINGTLVCEVRDFRKCISEEGTGISNTDGPIVNKVRLQISLENVVKDIPLISDDSWTYSDLLEVESRILKALQPELCLDPTPKLDRLCNDPRSIKFNLCFGRKRLRQTPEVTVMSNSQSHGKKVCIDGMAENNDGKQGDPLGNAAIQGIHENVTAQHGIPSTRPNNSAQDIVRSTLTMPSAKFQPSVNYPGVVHDRGTGSPGNFVGNIANVSSPQSLLSSYTESGGNNTNLLGKRENQDAQAASGLNRSKQTPMGLDGIQPQQLGSQFVGFNGQEMQWKNQLLRSQLDANGIHYPHVGAQRYPPQVMNNIPNQEAGSSFYFNQTMRYGPKEEQVDIVKLDRQELENSKDALQGMARENNALDQHQTSSNHLLKQPSMRNNLPPLTQWHNPRPIVDKDIRKDDVLQKRKNLTSPRVSSGPMVQSPVSSKSGEFSSGSVGGQFSTVATNYALGSQKVTTNSSAADGDPSSTSSPNDSAHRQPPAKRKSNSAQKTQAMSGVGSPSSVSNINAPLNASSPSTGTVAMGDQVERFTKIDMVTQRYQLNLKKNKVEDYSAKKGVGCLTQNVALLLKNSYNAKDFLDEMKPLSRSLIGGSISSYRTKLMTFTRDECNQGVLTRALRVIMAEKLFGGTVEMKYGDSDDSEFPNPKNYIVTLPTTNYADLLAAQFRTLMKRDGYKIIQEQVLPLPIPIGSTPGTLTGVAGIMPDNAAPEVKQEVASSPLSNISSQPINSGMGSLNSSQNLPNNARMLASGSNSSALPISPGYLPGVAMPQRPQQLDQSSGQQQQQIQQQQQQQIQQIQQQQQQIQRSSSSMLSANPLSQLMGQTSNLQMNANPMMNNKPNPMQLQMLQQQQQQNQRQAMMGPMGIMGNTSNNSMVGLGNMMGTRPMSGLGNVRPNQVNLGPISNFGGTRQGMSSDQAAAMVPQYKQVQQNNLMFGTNPMLQSTGGLPMLGHPMNRPNMSQLQRNAITSMGPPKISGSNYYLNPQQQLQQQQQHQQIQQQQQIGSSMQHSQVGSPSIVMQQQQLNQQQQIALSPQLSSGTLQQQMNNNSVINVGGAGPGSPQQLSSQAHGLVVSITSSPMEQLQDAVNKGGNV